ncbi:MAG: MFS transporter [Phascolarctobacterium sp.]|nr:MFS transporter [Phascolarctobacterium sp.]
MFNLHLQFSYITPVSTLVKWFSDNKGLATVLAIMGFVFASLSAGPVMQILMAKYGLANNFIIIGCIYAVVMTASALYLEPPKQYVGGKSSTSCCWSAIYRKRSCKNMAVFFINITCGVGLLAVASPMAQEIIKMTPMEAASMGVISLLNGLGRIVWSVISDKIGRPNTYVLFFAIEIIAFAMLADVINSLIFKLLIFIIITCYGGGFSCIPDYLSDIFGTKQLSAIHGSILTAW